MKIYELVFYWEDIYNGCEITETMLTTSRECVEAEIEDFRNSSLENGGGFILCALWCPSLKNSKIR